MIGIILGFVGGGFFAALFRDLYESSKGAERPRCWHCHRTFNDWRGVHFHFLATHDDPHSRVMPPGTGPYRE